MVKWYQFALIITSSLAAAAIFLTMSQLMLAPFGSLVPTLGGCPTERILRKLTATVSWVSIRSIRSGGPDTHQIWARDYPFGDTLGPEQSTHHRHRST